MNYSEFIKKHLGKAMDYNGVAGVQCVDLVKYYLDEVFLIKPGAWGDAKCYYENFYAHKQLVEHFTRIPNTPSFVPKKGDIVVWGANISTKHSCGHIAIASGKGTTSYFYSYDQNWGKKECTLIKHKYTALLGVLRPKNQNKIV